MKNQKPTVTETHQLLNFADYRPCSPYFIETGTCLGRSVRAAVDAGYSHIKSVEAKEDFYMHCCKLFARHMAPRHEMEPTIQLYQGKSIDHLGEMLRGIDEPAVLWLDAHVSGEASAGYHDYLAKGEGSDYHQHTALKKELAIVLAHRNDHIILIDDQNGPTPSNAEYIATLSAANPEYEFYWVDERQGEIFYPNKVLLAITKAAARNLAFIQRVK